MDRTVRDRAARSGERLIGWAEHTVLALVAFVPQLLTEPGKVIADNSSYLYIDIGRFLGQSATLWTPDYLGSVTYQQSGYLFPMGPFFWVVHAIGIPVWVGERLWVGALLFGAGSGVLYLCRTLGMGLPGRPVAAFAFMLSPYFLQVIGRQSGLLLPWAGLGWLLALTVRSVRYGGWRYPALFALVWVTVSGTNATGALLALIAPVLWLLYCVLVSHEHSWGELWAALWRITVLAFAVSFWWLVILAVEGRYGVNVLLYTETVRIEAITSLSSEILRGLGYWYFYGGDVLGPWQPTLTGFTQQPLLIAFTFAVPFLAILATVFVRWQRRGYFVLIVVVALAIAVGTHPYTDPSPFGGLLKAILHTKIGNALRSSDRATPTVVLGLAALLGAGVNALARRRRRAGLAAAVLCTGLVAAANPAVWNGTTLPSRYARPSNLPSYVTEAARALNAGGGTSSVLAIPGQSFAAYRYGTTLDPVWPGVLTRPYVERRLLPDGSLETFDLLYGLDNPIQTGTLDPASIAPMARLMGVGDVLVQNDLQYELYGQPDPRQLWQVLTPAPQGLGTATGYGSPVPNVPAFPDVTASTLAISPGAPWPSPVEVFSVENPRSTVRAESTSGDLVVDGDGVGVDAAAEAGLLDTSSPILYSATLGAHSQALADAMSGDAALVVTDSNRRQLFNWSSVQNNAGATLTATQAQPNPALDIFPGARSVTQSTAQFEGVANVTASYTGTEYAAMAMDGDPDTAWETLSGSNTDGQWWQVTLDHPTTASQITILQPNLNGYNYGQWITRATLTFDHRSSIHVTLSSASLEGQGQTIHFPSRTFKTLRITITRTNLSGASITVRSQAAPVGLAEVHIGQARISDLLVMPSDLLDKVGSSSLSHRLVLVMTRDRNTPDSPDSDPEPVLARLFTLPTSRTFDLTGQVHLSSAATDSTIDAATGRQTESGIVAYSSSRLPGDVADTASAALDGDPSTMWSPAFGTASQKGAWIQVNLPDSITFGQMDLQVVADRLHSIPTSMAIQACDQLASDQRCPSGSQTVDVRIPPISPSSAQDTTVTVPLTFPAVTGRYLTFTFTGVNLQFTKVENFQKLALPLGIADLGIPGVQVPQPPSSLPGGCQSDLLSVDGHSIWTQVTGSTSTALTGGALDLALCGPDAGGIALSPGKHVLESTPSQDTGFDVDELVMDSAPGGAAPSSPGSGGQVAAPSAGPAPTVKVTSATTTSFHVTVTGAKGPFWLVLGESINSGWKLTGVGNAQSTGPSLIDGFANGWLIDPGGTRTMSLVLRWTPQTSVTASILISAAATALCLIVAVWPRRARLSRSTDRHFRRSQSDHGRTVHDGPVTRPAAPEAPELVNAFTPMRPTSGSSAAVVALIVGLTGALLAPVPIIGLAAGVGIFLALYLPEYRILLSVGAVLFAAAAGLYVVLDQATQHFSALGWPTHFDLANDLVWASIVFLIADVVVTMVLQVREQQTS